MRPTLLQQRVEEASLNSWPALQTVLYDGWLLRFAKGYTRRANSVNALYGSRVDLHEKIDRCEAFYDQRGLPAVFRLTPFSLPGDLDRVLASRDYRSVDTTQVLVLGLGCRESPSLRPVLAGEATLDDWLRLFSRLGRSTREKERAHREILQAIPGKRLLMSISAPDGPVCCGMGVLEDGLFGLFDIVTDSRCRNEGYGTSLVSHMLNWAQDHGATHAYLTVVGTNAPARHVYAKFGFQEAYHYWYRVPGG